jgi:hypothetical protein
MPACDSRIVAASQRVFSWGSKVISYQLVSTVSLAGENHTIEADGGGGSDIPVTNLKGLVSRSLSDILAFVLSATGWERVWGGLNGCQRMDWKFLVSN